ncbi:hypothetical protein TWF696_003537 [Orbilia brochopaga]|uniref:Uncharacterized protein n=1 Tax=Orbilia brochopaga TaxID=3140254 RepID=A0AAV9TW29_9PEZI
MADNDGSQRHSSEKAEKLAAAKKRFEELKRKKQPTKKAAATASSNKQPQGPTGADDSESQPQTSKIAQVDRSETPSKQADSIDQAGNADTSVHVNTPGSDGAGSLPPDSTGGAKAIVGSGHGHRQSVSISDIPRSTEPSTPSSELFETLPDIYRKQALIIDELRSEKQRLLDENLALKSKNQETSKIIVERDKALEDVASLSEELAVLKETAGAEQAILREGAGEVNAQKAEIVGLNRELAHLQSQLIQKDKVITEMRRESTSTLPQNLRTKEEQLESLSVELSELRGSLQEAVSSTNELASERDHLRSQVEHMKSDLDKATEAADGLTHRLDAALQSAATDTANRTAYELKFQNQERTITELRQKLEEATTELRKLRDSNQELQSSERTAEARRRDMEKKLNIAQRENSGLQMRLAELRSSMQQLDMRPDKTPTDTMILGESSDSLWESKPSDLMEEDVQNPFSDVNLRAGGRQGSTASMMGQAHSIRALLPSGIFPGGSEHRSPDANNPELQILAQKAKEELGKWRGYSLDLVDVYKGYDNAYTGIFEV